MTTPETLATAPGTNMAAELASQPEAWARAAEFRHDPARRYWAFDVGGTDIKSALVDRYGRVLGVRHTPTPRRSDDPSLHRRPTLVPAQLGEDAGLLGTALAARDLADALASRGKP